MKECKCGRRLSDPLDPPREETMQWACDVLEHHLKMFRELNRASKLPIEITEEHIKIINRFMEENKKKMTKAEAFEWLKCKKVDASNNERSVQSKLFSLGVVWCTRDTNPTLGVRYLFIDQECRMSHCGGNLDYYKSHCYEEISAEDILSIEIVEDEPLDKWDEFARCVAKVQEKIEEDEVCIITKGNFLTMTK